MSRQQKIKRKKEKTTRNGACARTTVIPDTLVRSERRNPTALPIPTQLPAAARYKYNSRQRPEIQSSNRALVYFPAIDPTGGHPSLSFLFRAHNGTPAGPMADRPVYARAWSVIKGPRSQYSFYLRPVFGIFFLGITNL